MDPFARRYTLVLSLLLIGGLGYWLASSWQPRAGELNQLLKSDAMLAGYPYPFRVVSVRDGVAILSTPRSFEVPAYRFLELLHPQLINKPQDDPAVVAAQQDLINHQRRAQSLMLTQPDIERVDWELDVRWLADRGIHPAPPR